MFNLHLEWCIAASAETGVIMRRILFGGTALALEGYEAVLLETNPSPVCGTGAAEALRASAGAAFEIEVGVGMAGL